MSEYVTWDQLWGAMRQVVTDHLQPHNVYVTFDVPEEPLCAIAAALIVIAVALVVWVVNRICRGGECRDRGAKGDQESQIHARVPRGGGGLRDD